MNKMESYRKKVLACWMGKNIGGTLGAPFEGIPSVNNLTYYDPVPSGSLPNDDLELQVMYSAALDRMEGPEINREILADIWLRHMNYHCDEYAVAMKNLSIGIRPPWSGSYDNYFIDGMGAAIRSELWACLAPGDPELAVKFAYEDACVDHAGNGIDAEVFLAALESLAFVEADIPRLIDESLNFLPEKSDLRDSIRMTCDLWNSTGDWLTVRNEIMKLYSSEFKTCVLPNVPFTVLALLSGGGDFGKTICDAANCGMDTDCTAATAGAVMGILNPEGIPEKWLRPIGHELIVRSTAIRNLTFPPTIEALTDQILSLRERIPARVREIKTAKPDYSRHQISCDVAMRKNLRWYQVDLNAQEWKTMRFDSIYSSLEIPPEYRGCNGQVVLRFRFEIPDDGEYSLMFNSPTSNQVYLDPVADVLHDDVHMLFGRQRLWDEKIVFGERFSCGDRQVIFSPTLGGAPLNQYKRHLHLSKGMHTLIAALEPLSDEREIIWGFGVGDGNRFLQV